MKTSRNPALAVSVVILIITLGRVVQSPAIQSIRAVDMLTLFAAGAAAGVALCLAFIKLRSKG